MNMASILLSSLGVTETEVRNFTMDAVRVVEKIKHDSEDMKKRLVEIEKTVYEIRKLLQNGEKTNV